MDWFNITFSGIVAVSTVFYVILTSKLVSETRKNRELQTTPVLSVYIEVGEADIAYKYIVFENIGYGVAKNVNFFVIQDSTYHDNMYDRLEEKGIFQNGLSYFYPKQKFKYFLSHTPSIPDEHKNGSIEIEIKYENIFGTEKSERFCIKLNEYYGKTQQSPPNSYLGRISFALKEINETLKLSKDNRGC